MTYNSSTARLFRGGLTAVTATVLLALAFPAQAAPRETAARGDWLFVTVTTGDARSSDTRGTLLSCDPPQGHRRAAEACAQLASAAGEIGAIPAGEVYCPMVHAPVTAQARGQWNGRTVDYTETFANACTMTARTGAVFALDD